MTKLICYNQKISAPCESRRTSIFTSYIFQYGWHCWHNSGQPVASRWWVDGGPTVASRRWPADGGPTSASNGNVPPAHRWTAGGNLPFIATGGPTASCYVGFFSLNYPYLGMFALNCPGQSDNYSWIYIAFQRSGGYRKYPSGRGRGNIHLELKEGDICPLDLYLFPLYSK